MHQSSFCIYVVQKEKTLKKTETLWKKAGSKNESAIHWDLLKNMRVSGSKILADDQIIYEEGNWVIPD